MSVADEFAPLGKRVACSREGKRAEFCLVDTDSYPGTAHMAWELPLVACCPRRLNGHWHHLYQPRGEQAVDEQKPQVRLSTSASFCLVLLCKYFTLLHQGMLANVDWNPPKPTFY